MHVKRIFKTSIIMLLIYFVSACANRMEANVVPGTDLNSLKSMHVIKLEADKRGINSIVKERLEKQGVVATTGSREDAPENVGALVTYIDKWMWDITMYMLELTVVIRTPENDFPMATGNSMHTSLTRKSSEGMVDEVITNIYNANLEGSK